ncbi:MAG: cytochrome b/b6 domain-containing protein [Hyphomicrobiales bacterium]
MAIHGYIGFFITALIVAHIGAALMHQFIKKDGVLLRMLRT